MSSNQFAFLQLLTSQIWHRKGKKIWCTCQDGVDCGVANALQLSWGLKGRSSAILAQKKINISAAHQEPQVLKTKTAKVSGNKIRRGTQKLQEMSSLYLCQTRRKKSVTPVAVMQGGATLWVKLKRVKTGDFVKIIASTWLALISSRRLS